MQVDLSADAKRAERLKERTCRACLHYTVCALNKAVAIQLHNIYGEKANEIAPFTADELAKICKAYIPIRGEIEP
jgi:hypothetical protein